MAIQTYTQLKTATINTPLSERELIEKAQKDSRYFEPLYKKHYQEIFWFIFRKVGEKEVAADICSDVFLKALMALKRYKVTNVPFVTWLYRIAINETNGFFRKSKKERLVVLDDVLLDNMKEEITESLDIEEVAQLLEKAIQVLKPLEVEMVELRFFHQKSYKEIGEMLDIKENNAKVKMHRILAKLKKNI